MDWSRFLNTVLERLNLFTWLGLWLSGFLTLASQLWLEKLGLAEFVSKWRPWISLTFLVCVLLSVRIACYKAMELLYKRQKQRKVIKELERLTPSEKGIVRRLYHASALRLPVMNPVVVSLLSKAIIIQASPYVENRIDLPCYPELGRDQNRYDLASTFKLSPIVLDLLEFLRDEPESENEVQEDD